MADPNTRQGKRTPVTLKIKFKSETLEQFIERYAVDVSQGGIFIRTKEPLAVGTQMKFEFQLRDASPLIAGEGTVVWTRENDPSRPAIAPGMGVRFDRLNDGSQAVLERILAEKAKQAPHRGGSETAPKPLFTDTPTKVAPVPVQDALGVRSRNRADSEQTPLPKPMPFHSDADDFDEKAFEEATKVRSLEQLAAQTAQESDEEDEEQADAAPSDELAARRGQPDRESTPGLPNPPESGRRLLDTTPSPRQTETPDPDVRTKLGVEPAKPRRTPTPLPALVEVPPRQKRRSAAPAVILVLVLVAAAAGGVWWFVLREQVAEEANKPTSGSALVAGSAGSDLGSAATTGSAGSAVATATGSNVDTAPKGPMVDTVIAASVAKGATVEIVGTDQKGPAPLTAKLEKDKAYKARVQAPGFLVAEVEVKGGQDKVTAKLALKPHVISVTSEPPGADIYIEGANTKQLTPADVELSAAQAAKPKLRVGLRRTGFRAIDQVVDEKAFTDEDARMIAKVEAKLVQAARPNPGGTTSTGTTTHTPTGSGATTGSGSGSATTPPNTGSGAGSSTTPSGGAGSSAGSATPPPPSGGGGGAGSATKPPAAGSGTSPAPSPSGSPTSATNLLNNATRAATSEEPTPTWAK